MEEKRYPKIRLAEPAILLMGILALASRFATKGPEGPDIIGFDKVAHFFVFGLMGTLWFRFFDGELRSKKRFLQAWALVAGWGLLDETIQAMNPARNADAWDLVANASGAFVAIWVYRGWSFYRRVLETPVRDLARGKLMVEDCVVSREDAKSRSG
ncbi:MAG: VanZ family protein [Verrucomicrobiota bacterium]